MSTVSEYEVGVEGREGIGRERESREGRIRERERLTDGASGTRERWNWLGRN